ncbi:serine protease [Virgibacillus necropolis]|uniref:Serine protease n=2 Tax=Virgibacillus necropolis TaxID=163877 RepID=A0A221MIG6_9BACI|nr:serine protease [Virgibacillus necropolis]
MYNQWYATEASVSNSGINKINNSPQTLNLKSIIHKAEKNVMQIEGENGDTKITGSGFLYNEKGDIITNAHVVKDADVINVRTSNARVYPAAIVGISEETDIAVIRVPQMANQSPIQIEKEIKADIGDEVIALGSPHGFQNTVTLGIISGTERNFSVDGYDYENVYQISAQITHGNSGGPLIDRTTGKVIGINSVGTKDGTIGFSIPLANVIDQIERWSNEAQTDNLDFSTSSKIINNINEDAFKEDAEYLINYFLDSILIRDYISAYTILGSEMQGQNSYSAFREQYIHVINLNFNDFTTTLTDNNQVETTVKVDYSIKQPNEEKVSKATATYNFIVGYENDQLKILNISKVEK